MSGSFIVIKLSSGCLRVFLPKLEVSQRDRAEGGKRAQKQLQGKRSGCSHTALTRAEIRDRGENV